MNYEKMTTAELVDEIKLLKSTLEDTESKHEIHIDNHALTKVRRFERAFVYSVSVSIF